MVTNYEGDSIEFKEHLPLLPVRDLVVYPFMILPLFVGRETSIKAVEEALNHTDRLILLSSQKIFLLKPQLLQKYMSSEQLP
jgi:ATP-dependent Lon protease